MKPIKFNLRYGNMQIRDLDELKDNCNIDMLLEKFQSGELERWIIPQNKPDILAKIRALAKDSDITKTAAQLCSILLGMEITEAQKVAVSVYGERKKEEYRLAVLATLADEEKDRMARLNINKKEIIAEYFAGFYRVLDEIDNYKKDYASLEEYIEKANDEYYDICNFISNYNKSEKLERCSVIINLAKVNSYESLLDMLEKYSDDYYFLEKAMEKLYKDFFAQVKNDYENFLDLDNKEILRTVEFNYGKSNFYERFYPKHPLVLFAMSLNDNIKSMANHFLVLDDTDDTSIKQAFVYGARGRIEICCFFGQDRGFIHNNKGKLYRILSTNCLLKHDEHKSYGSGDKGDYYNQIYYYAQGAKRDLKYIIYMEVDDER